MSSTYLTGLVLASGRWLSKILPHPPGVAYRSTKRTRNIHKYLSGKAPVSRKRPPLATLSYTETEISRFVLIAYRGASEHRICIYPSNAPVKFGIVSNKMKLSGRPEKLDDVGRIDRKSAWIRATPEDSDNRGWASQSQVTNPAGGKAFGHLKPQAAPHKLVMHYGSTLSPGTVPATVNRRVPAEYSSSGRPGSLWASKAPTTRAALLGGGEGVKSFVPRIIICFFLTYLPSCSKPCIFYPSWWNTQRLFLLRYDEGGEPALGKLRSAEELFRLYELASPGLPPEYPTNDRYPTNKMTMKKYGGTARPKVCNNDTSPPTTRLKHSPMNLANYLVPSASLVPDEERLAITNPRAAGGSARSSNDTMKALLIPPLTDSCIGFHPPHGWGILIDTSLRHLGFAPNGYVTPCPASTFPVVPDTVSKHWISRYSNRISPSVVATYHTMNERPFGLVSSTPGRYMLPCT
uniref:Chloroplast envelope membrane protein n=1 Tax=Selaginella kraussiana TaxID=81964 RepID=A0A3Q9R2P6_9TRAC|nr:chloroplast envelope membrane protein [Selaginella kraussiana]AZU95789.1 chloroplast envelope membrane protein [Selaginella kraussiana]